MKVYSKDTFAEVYRDMLSDLMGPEGQTSNPRSSSTKEIVDVCLEIKNPISSLYKNKIRSSQSKYIAAEFMWYFLGRNDVKFISKYAKFWERIANPDGTVNSSYGNLLFKNRNEHDLTEYEWALQSLVKDKDSRQAVMHFNLPKHQSFENKDFVCTMYASFLIRNNKLRMSVKMRSNDVILGLPTDVAFFTVLQQQMLMHLKETYPGLELGTYSHVVDSMHVYSTEYDRLNEMLKNEFIPCQMPMLNSELICVDSKPSNELKTIEEDIETDIKDSYKIMNRIDEFKEDDMLSFIYYNLFKNRV
jgi:thymidylate synthase